MTYRHRNIFFAGILFSSTIKSRIQQSLLIIENAHCKFKNTNIDITSIQKFTSYPRLSSESGPDILYLGLLHLMFNSQQASQIKTNKVFHIKHKHHKSLGIFEVSINLYV